jgi:RNA polymerase sigma factor (sigma-70 family)
MNDLSRAAELAVAHSARLALYARQWLDAEAARDVVQEALAALLSQRKCPEDPVAWMYKVVRNAAIDATRSRWRRRRREEHVARQEWFDPPAESVLDARTAQQALEKLPCELREIVVLKIWGELSFPRIAEVAHVSVGTAHQRFMEAMKQLREQLNV